MICSTSNNEHKIVFMPCDDAEEAAEFVLTNFDDGPLCELNIVDSYCGSRESKLKYRLYRAWKAFKGDPIYYSGICISNTDTVKQWFKDCLYILDNNS